MSFDEGALPEIDGRPVHRPDFPDEMTSVIDDHFTEHGRSKSIYKCGHNKDLVNMVRGDVSGWHQSAEDGMQYVAALGQLLVRTHDASGH
eukprot:COSAG02_NODE_904_length_16045_cov_3920.854697_9_plen_90_part_00